MRLHTVSPEPYFVDDKSSNKNDNGISNGTNNNNDNNNNDNLSNINNMGITLPVLYIRLL